VVEKGTVLRSGSGGDGVDHWHLACTNPASKITPEEMVEYLRTSFNDYGYGEFGNGIAACISCKESYSALLDVEKMGVKVRDGDDNFVGAPFRDEATKLLFAYDYDRKLTASSRRSARRRTSPSSTARSGREGLSRSMATLPRASRGSLRQAMSSPARRPLSRPAQPAAGPQNRSTDT